MNTAKTVFFSLILSFWLPLLPVLAETPVDPGKLKASSDKFVDTIFSETDKIPTKEAYLCAYKHFENIPDGLKKILAEKGVAAGFDSMPKAQKEKYKAEEKNLLTGAFKCAMDDMIGNLAGKMADKAAAPLRLKANDSAAKADIYNVRLACLDFWKNNGDDKNCSLADAKKNGYVPFKDVAVTVMNGLKKDFAAVGKHNKSDTEWKIGISKQFFMKTKDSGQFTKPPPEKPGERKANSIAKSQLHNLFLACKAFWADEGGNNKCTLEVAGSNAYGFVLFPYVDVKVLNFQEITFEAYAHTKNSDGFAWKVKSDGSIVLFLPESETSDSLEKKHKDSDYLDPLQLAVTAGRKDLVKDLLKKGYDPAKFNRYGDSSLHMALKSQGAKRKPVDMKMIALLVQPGTDVSIQDREGMTLLHFAAAWGDKELAQFLIDKGADVNIKSRKGKTPLGFAKENHNEAIANLLMKKGAKEGSPEMAKQDSKPKNKRDRSYIKIGQTLGGLFFALGTLEASATDCANLAMYKEYFNEFSKNVLIPASHDAGLIKNFFSLYEKHKGSGLVNVMDKVLDRNRKNAFKSTQEEFQEAKSNRAKAKLCSRAIKESQSGMYNMSRYATDFFNIVQKLNPVSFNAAKNELDDLQLFKAKN